MPTPTYIPLATITLGSTDSSIVFSSIPATYRDLIVVLTGSSTSGGISSKMNFNSDTGNNYLFVRMGGDTSSTFSSSGQLGYAYIGDNNNQIRTSIVQIMDYSVTNKQKTSLIRYAGNHDNVQAIAANWTSTAAITTVALAPVSGSWTSGSTFSLYGIAA